MKIEDKLYDVQDASHEALLNLRDKCFIAISNPRNSKIILFIAFTFSILFALWHMAMFGISLKFQTQVNTDATLPDYTGSEMISTELVDLTAYDPLRTSTWFGTSSKLASEAINVENVTVETTLNMVLKGTILGATPTAIIRDNETRRSHVVKEGGKIINGVTLKKISRRRVVLNNNGKLEALSLPGESYMHQSKIAGKVKAVPRIRASANKYIHLFNRPVTRRQQVVISKAEVLKTFSNIGNFGAEAHFSPHIGAGKIDGYNLVRLENNSFLSKLTLRENDTFVKVDDVPVSDRKKIFPLLMGLKDASEVNLVINRKGEQIAIKVIIE